MTVLDLEHYKNNQDLYNKALLELFTWWEFEYINSLNAFIKKYKVTYKEVLENKKDNYSVIFYHNTIPYFGFKDGKQSKPVTRFYGTEVERFESEMKMELGILINPIILGMWTKWGENLQEDYREWGKEDERVEIDSWCLKDDITEYRKVEQINIENETFKIQGAITYNIKLTRFEEFYNTIIREHFSLLKQIEKELNL